MKLGLKKIVGKMTDGDEYGVYRQNEEGHQYLMFSTSTYREAIKYGPKVAKVLGVGFLDHLPVPENPEAEEDENVCFTPATGQEIKDAYDCNLDEDYPSVISSRTKALENYDPSNKQSIRPKPGRVSGVAKKVKPMIADGKTDEEIFDFMLGFYIAAGRTTKEAKELLMPYLKDIRAGKY